MSAGNETDRADSRCWRRRADAGSRGCPSCRPGISDRRPCRITGCCSASAECEFECGLIRHDVRRGSWRRGRRRRRGPRFGLLVGRLRPAVVQRQYLDERIRPAASSLTSKSARGDQTASIQKSLGDLRVCMLAEDLGPREDDERPSQWLDRASRTVLEARRGSLVQRLEVTRQGAVQQVSWHVGCGERPFDAAAQQWRDRMLATFDAMWELSRLRGEVSSLRGEISSIHGEESSLRGEISSLRGEVSSLRGRISSIRGEESSLRGEISSIRGHLSSLGARSRRSGAPSPA